MHSQMHSFIRIDLRRAVGVLASAWPSQPSLLQSASRPPAVAGADPCSAC